MLNEISRLCLQALGGFSHAFRAITHNATMKINAKKSYFVIGFAPFQGLSLNRLPLLSKRLFQTYYSTIVCTNASGLVLQNAGVCAKIRFKVLYAAMKKRSTRRRAAQREATKRTRMRLPGWKGLASMPGKVASELFRGTGRRPPVGGNAAAALCHEPRRLSAREFGWYHGSRLFRPLGRRSFSFFSDARV